MCNKISIQEARAHQCGKARISSERRLHDHTLVKANSEERQYQVRLYFAHHRVTAFHLLLLSKYVHLQTTRFTYEKKESLLFR